MATTHYQQPLISVRKNRRHEILNMTQMNGDNLNKLRHLRTSEFGRIVRSWNMQLTRSMRKNVGQWYRDHNSVLANCSKDQKKICRNLNRYNIEQRRVYRNEYKKHQEHIRQTLERLRIKFIARKVVNKFRENVSNKKALRAAKRKSKRGNASRVTLNGIHQNETIEENDEPQSNRKNVLESCEPTQYVDPNETLLQLSAENVKELEKLHEKAKKNSETYDEASKKKVRDKSKYLEVQKGLPPKTVATSNQDQEMLTKIIGNLQGKILELPPLKTVSRVRIPPPSKAVLVANLDANNDKAIGYVSKVNDPKFVMNFEPILENDENDAIKDSQPTMSCLPKSSDAKSQNLDHSTDISSPLVGQSGLIAKLDKNSDYFSRSDSDRSPVSSGKFIKQSVLNRIKRREAEELRNQVLNTEPHVAYVRNKDGEVVLSKCVPRRCTFKNETARLRYEREKFKKCDEERILSQKKRLKDFFQKLKETGTRRPLKPKSPPPIIEENVPKLMRRTSLSISTLLNRPFTKSNADEEDLLMNCSYIREYEPVQTEEDRIRLRQRKKSSWLLPQVSESDQINLASLHQKAVSDYLY